MAVLLLGGCGGNKSGARASLTPGGGKTARRAALVPQDDEPTTVRVLSCGTERWPVKTGTEGWLEIVRPESNVGPAGGYAIGFRFSGGFLAAVGAILLAMAFGHAFSWLSALLGLSIRDVESTQAASFASIFPFVFASSAFVPIASMPGWLQALAKVNPITLGVNGVRSLTFDPQTVHAVVGGTRWTHVVQALLAIAVMVVIFVPLSIRAYRKT